MSLPVGVVPVELVAVVIDEVLADGVYGSVLGALEKRRQRIMHDEAVQTRLQARLGASEFEARLPLDPELRVTFRGLLGNLHLVRE